MIRDKRYDERKGQKVEQKNRMQVNVQIAMEKRDELNRVW